MDSPETSNRADAPRAGVGWRRRGTRRIRPISRPDVDVLAEMSRLEAISHRLVPDDDRLARGDRWLVPQAGRLVERDHRITAAVALQPGRSHLEPGRHPWSKVSRTDPDLYRRQSPPAPDLLVTDLVYHPDASHPDASQVPGPPSWLLDGPIRRPCQRLGASRAIALVAPTYPATRDELTTATFLQQLYFAGLDDPMLSAFMAADFQPHGYLAAEDSPFGEDRVMMIWDNPRQN